MVVGARIYLLDLALCRGSNDEKWCDGMNDENAIRQAESKGTARPRKLEVLAAGHFHLLARRDG